MDAPAPQARDAASPKMPGFSTQRRIGNALVHEFGIVSGFKHGYRNREDDTVLPPGVLIQGSQNVLTNTFERIGIRKGYTLDGQADTAIAPIASAADILLHNDVTRHLRAGFNTTGSNGKLQFRYVANAGDKWNGHTFTQDQVYWIDLKTSLTSVDLNFTGFWDNTNLRTQILYVDGSSNIFDWSGAVTTLKAVSNTAGVIKTMNTTPNLGGTAYAVGNVLTLTTASGIIQTISITDGGSGYIVGDTLTVTTAGGHGGNIEVDTLGGGGSVATAHVINGGYGYATGAGQTTTSTGVGTGCTINITAITSLSGTGATITVSAVSSGAVTAFTITNPGTGYTAHNGYAVTGGAGSGAKFEILTTATGYIQKNGTDSWYAEGFDPATSNVLINGTTYAYTGGGDNTFLVGISPSALAEPLQSLVFNPVHTNPNADSTDLPDNLANSLIATLYNQVYIGSLVNINVYLSKQFSFTDFSQSNPRDPGDGDVISLDQSPIGFSPQETEMYISTKDLWYAISFQLSADLTNESVLTARLKTTARQGAQSQAFITKIKNNVAFLSFEPIINSLGLVSNVLNFPQTVDLSNPIVNLLNTYDFTDGAMMYNKQFLYVTVPTESIMLIYNMTDQRNPYWEAPQIFPFSRLSVIDGDLYAHSYQVGETYKLFSGYNDNGHAINAVAKFSFNSYGTRAYSKSFNSHWQDGYISPNTTLNLGFQFDLDGCSTNTVIPISGADTQIVCAVGANNSLGKNSLGKQPLGSQTLVTSAALPPYFHSIKTFPRIPFYLESTSFSSNGIDEQWEIISFGASSTPTSEGNNSITQ